MLDMLHFLNMDSVKEIKDWLINKCRLSSSANSDVSTNLVGDSNKHCSALTPKRIPEFVIPGSGESSRRQSSELESIDEDFAFQSFSPRNSIASSNKTSPANSPMGSTSCLDVPRVPSFPRSAPVSPKHEMKSLNSNSAHSLGYNEDGTNSDPLSLAAMSLPHFRAQTSYGFTTLSQSPHTRRKESLFHTSSDTLLSRRVNPFEGFKIGSMPDGPHEILVDSEDIFTGKNCKCRRPSVVLTPSSGNPIVSPIKARSFDESMGNSLRSPASHPSNGGIAYFKSKGRYYRRRSSLLGLNASSDDSSQSSAETSPVNNKTRRSTPTLYLKKDPNVLKRHSSPHVRSKSSKGRLQTPTEQSKDIFVSFKEPPCQFLVQHGELKFAFQYLAKSKQLKTTIIRAENLGGQAKSDQNINSSVKVYLLPGKLQKQATEVVKHTRHPVFNQEFYFTGLTLEQLHAMTLRIKVFHRSSNLKLPDFIGKVDVNLDSFDLLTENRMWKDLDNKRDQEDLGSLEISLRYQPKEDSICVTVEQAKCLPHHPITGQPNPYVRLEFHQPNKSVSRKNTKTKKNASDPIYRESFVFNLSQKRDDLKSTKLILTVFDHDRIRSDNCIGQVVLCPGAQQPTAEEHWVDAISRPGQTITIWHDLYDHDEDFK